ncbi:MAG: M48 family metalloprotease, partial [Alphaproteobacteria bacterium]
YIVNDRDLNAFVAGGQNLFLNTGLIMKTKNPNELMGVMAHEIGHMAGGHLVRNDEGTRAAIVTQFITMGIGLAAAFAGHDARGAAVIMASAGEFATLQYFTFTRVQESSADQAAATYLEASGNSGKGLVEFFNNFKYEEVFADPEKKDPFFRSHPLTSERIEALRETVVHNPHYSAKDTPENLAQHAIMIAKLKAYMNYSVITLTDYPETDTSFPARYARAIAYYKDVETTKALDALDGLIKDNPDNPYLEEFKGQVLYERGRVAEAAEPLRKAVELAPKAPLLRFSYAQTLLATRTPDNIKEALDTLIPAVNLERDNGEGWRLLADAYEKSGNSPMAKLSTAEGAFQSGNMIDARNFARRAQEALPKDTPEYRRASDIVSAAEGRVMREAYGGRGG